MQAHITNNVLAGDIEFEAPDLVRIRLDVEAMQLEKLITDSMTFLIVYCWEPKAIVVQV